MLNFPCHPCDEALGEDDTECGRFATLPKSSEVDDLHKGNSEKPGLKYRDRSYLLDLRCTQRETDSQHDWDHASVTAELFATFIEEAHTTDRYRAVYDAGD